MRWWDGVTDSTDISLSKLREIAKERGRLACCSSWIAKRHDLATEQQQRLIHIVVQLKPTQYCKVIILQLKKKKVQAHSRFPQRFSQWLGNSSAVSSYLDIFLKSNLFLKLSNLFFAGIKFSRFRSLTFLLLCHTMTFLSLESSKYIGIPFLQQSCIHIKAAFLTSDGKAFCTSARFLSLMEQLQ